MIIIFGIKTLTNRQKGNIYLHRYCPICNKELNMYYDKIRKYFTLFFIPIIPLEKGEDVLTCSNCKKSFYINSEEKSYIKQKKRNKENLKYYKKINQANKEIDRILEKISKKGYKKLTRKEKIFLKNHSINY